MNVTTIVSGLGGDPLQEAFQIHERRRTLLLARGCRPGNASPFFVSIGNHEAIRGNHAIAVFLDSCV